MFETAIQMTLKDESECAKKVARTLARTVSEIENSIAALSSHSAFAY